MRILIVEDSDTIRMMLETLVGGRGHKVEAVRTGTKGIESALANRPDVILLDLNLPGGKDGIAVIRQLRATAETTTVPILVISAADGLKNDALEAGATSFYAKPFSPTALLKHLETLRPSQRPK
jgi:DNA-binding response OmpR family regulator